jgi:hypothetical protein
MIHTMHIDNKWSMLPLDLDCLLDFKPWNILTPLTLKKTNLEAMSFCFRSPCVIKEFMISKVRLLTLDP